MRLPQIVLRAALLSPICTPYMAFSQAFPVKPIRIVVSAEPAGLPDITARTLTPRMSEQLGQPVIVENRSGAGGQIGAQVVARSAPDGYTILVGNGANHFFSIFAYKSLAYHPVKDFTPITDLLDPVVFIAASVSFPPNSLRDLIDYANRNPGKVFYGTTGVGGASHLSMEQIGLISGAKMEHVPFKGAAPLILNLFSGQVPVGIATLSALSQHVRAGKLKLLAAMSSKRSSLEPDVQSIAEAVPDIKGKVLSGKIVVLGPAGLTQPVVARLNSAIVFALNSPEVREKFEASGNQIIGNSPAEMADGIKIMTVLGAQMFKAAGIEPE